MSVASTAMYPSPGVQLGNWPSYPTTASQGANGNPSFRSDSVSTTPSAPPLAPDLSRAQGSNTVATAHKPKKSKPKASTVYLAAGLAGLSITTFMWLILPSFHELIAARQKRAFQDAVAASATTYHEKLAAIKSKHQDTVVHHLGEKFKADGHATMPCASALEQNGAAIDEKNHALMLVRDVNEQRLLVARALQKYLEPQSPHHVLVEWNVNILKKENDPHFSIHAQPGLITAEKEAHGAFTHWADKVYQLSYHAAGMAKKL